MDKKIMNSKLLYQPKTCPNLRFCFITGTRSDKNPPHDFISRTLVASRNYQNNCVHEKWSRSYAGIHSTVVT